MTARLTSAAIIISLLVTAVAFDLKWGATDSIGFMGITLVPLVLVITVLAAYELASMIASRNPSTPLLIVVLGSVVTVGCSCLPAIWKDYPADCTVGKLGWNSLGLALAACIAIVFEMLRFKEADRVIANLAYSIFAITYTGFLMSFLPALRFMGSNEVGMTALMSMIVVVKASDAGAFFTGKMLGRRKLAPKMSPGKSVEGAIGAVLTGCGASVFFFAYIAPLIHQDLQPPTTVASVLFGLVIALTGMIGDLFESIIKRDFKAKDSSSWLPGLGGVLDIFDSILAAAPAAYVLWVSGLFN